MTPKKLLIPSNAEIARYIADFSKDDRYYPADKAIDKLITCFPENKLLEDILLKVTAINRLYSTSVYNVNKMARYILSKNIDEQLIAGDLSLVDSIAYGHKIISSKNKKEIHCYSFATKYCNWHNKSAYPIYDSFVDKILFAYQKQDNFSKFSKTELRQYTRFSEIVADFIKFYSITNYNLKEIDKFLWKYGQKVFQK